MASWDPSALLNPKARAKDGSKKRATNYGPQQSRKPAPPIPEGGPTAIPPTPHWQANPGVLLNPKSAPTTAATTHTPAPDKDAARPPSRQQNQPEEAPGMLDLLARQHNLSNREAPPAKKRKTEASQDEQQDDQKSKSTFAGAHTNGELGQHIKEQREKAAAGPQTPAIDLTNEDDDESDGDDDIQILGSAAKNAKDNERVCLGMLRAQANASYIPHYSRSKSTALGANMYPPMRVQEKRLSSSTNEIGLFSRPAAGQSKPLKFAKIDVKVAAALCVFLDTRNTNNLELQVYLDSVQRRPGEAEGSMASRAMPIRILLFAPRYKVKGIGKVLSQRNVWLEHPSGVPISRIAEVVNPHAAPTTFFGDKSAKRTQNGPPSYGLVRTQEEMDRATRSMFDDLVKARELPEMDPNADAIKTELKGLQKQALHFLTQHEKAADDKQGGQISLWKAREGRKGTVWANIITNHELPHRPEPIRGGILADEMGLGKTLNILSLHASTLDEAKQFGERKAPLDLENISRNAKATLVVCPKSVMTNWIQQIKEHTVGRFFNVYSYHGSERTQDVDELASYDIVLVPYGTVSSEFGQVGSRNALASINWFRIVLDEAHTIRTASTQISKACCNLTAERRWAVTGTPVQNRLDDLGTLIKFLRIKPFDDDTSWSKHIMAPFKTGDEHVLQHLQLLVASVTLRRTKDKAGAGLPERTETTDSFEFSEEEMAMYAQFSGQANIQVKAMTRQGRIQGKGYAYMLRSIHRLRAICAHGQEMLSEDDMKELEGLTIQTAIDLGDEPKEDGADASFITEKQAYDFLHMMIESQSDVCTKCGRHLTQENPTESETRESSDDKSVSGSDSDSDSDSDDVDSEAAAKKDVLGYINPCYDHLICPECHPDYVRRARATQRVDGHHECPYCDQYIRFGLFELRRHALRSFLEAKAPRDKKQRTKWNDQSYSGPHTKVKALINELKQTASESRDLLSGEPPFKSVVFSGWTTYLDLIEYALDEHEIKHVRLDGTMSVKQRTKVLDEFRDDDDITVILVSIKAGGQGLNLTSANKVYMMEPQFNPGVEQQAIDRVHRMGQTRPVFIKHFIMKDSIEGKIQEMQKRKQALASLAMEKKVSKGEAAKKRIEELRELFK